MVTAFATISSARYAKEGLVWTSVKTHYSCQQPFSCYRAYAHKVMQFNDRIEGVWEMQTFLQDLKMVSVDVL